MYNNNKINLINDENYEDDDEVYIMTVADDVLDNKFSDNNDNDDSENIEDNSNINYIRDNLIDG